MQIQRIRKNHENILLLPVERLQQVFGANAHKFSLHPPVLTSAVVAYEEKYEFTFPEGYRRFITEVGDGGAGPFYGIKQRFVTYGIGLREAEAKCFRLPSIYSQVCPQADAWEEALLGEDHEELINKNDSLFWQGNMNLFEVGCGTMGMLVLNGPHVGSVCLTDFGFSPYQFWTPPAFLDMYEQWQDAILSGSKGTGFGF